MKKFGYYNPKALEILAKCEDLYRVSKGKGLLNIKAIIDMFGLEYNKSNQITVGRGLKTAGFRKIRVYPEQRYMYTRDSTQELLDGIHATLGSSVAEGTAV